MTRDCPPSSVQRPYTAPRPGQVLSVTEVIPDAFTELWIRFSDGAGRHLDLTPLAQRPGFTALQDHFSTACIGQHSLSVVWDGHVTLPLSWLYGTPPGQRASQIKVRQQGSGGPGWFRPLATLIPTPINAKDAVRTLSRVLALPRHDIPQLLSAYPVPQDLAAQRLLDLIQYLAWRQHASLTKAAQQLGIPWAWGQDMLDDRMTTPLAAIRIGMLALVERIITTNASPYLETSTFTRQPPTKSEKESEPKIQTIKLAAHPAGTFQARARAAFPYGGGLYGQLKSPGTLLVSHVSSRGSGAYPWSGEYVRGWADGAQSATGKKLHHIGFWLHVPERDDLDPVYLRDILTTAEAWFAKEAPPWGALLLMIRDTPEGDLNFQLHPLSRPFRYADQVEVMSLP